MSDSQRPHAQRVVAVRVDGLGQRLLAILRAMHLADLLGADYAFTWSDDAEQQHHALPPAADAFTDKFLAARLVAEPLEGYADIRKPYATLEGLRRLAEGSRGWAMRLSNANRHLRPGLQRTPDGYYRRLFDQLQFRRYIRRAIAFAHQTALPADAVAMHLRAGDIVYGRHRYRDRYTRKVIPLPVARWMIDQWTETGQTVVLFGQDPAAARLFRGRANVIIAADLAARLEKPVAQALFEIVLMSRCREIHAGFSGFAQLAARIADVRVKGPEQSVPPEKQIEIIQSDLANAGRVADYPPLQTAFSAWTAAYLLEAQDPAQGVPLLRTAIRNDPTNGYYRLKLASFLYRLHRDAEAEAELRGLLVEEARDAAKARSVAVRVLTEHARTPGRTTMAAEHRVFAEAADRGAPLAGHLMAHVERARSGDRVRTWATLPTG